MVRFNFSPGSSNRSRKERLEQAKREAEAEQTRRRNFGFLKNADNRMSSTSLSRTREHAKQLAMVYNDPIETPTSVNSGQGLLNFDTMDTSFDPFGHNDAHLDNQFGFSTKRTVTNASMLDQHFATSKRQDREPTASTLDSFETMSVGSAYDMDFLPSKPSNTFASPPLRNNRKGSTSLDHFVEKTKSPAAGPESFSGVSHDRSRAERSVISMPTFPTNSSMQASFARQHSTPTSTSSAGAAARRRFRNQMRHSSSNGSVSSSVDDASYHSGAATPPESPASSSRHTTGSAGKNRVAAYQRTQSGSFYSQASSTGNNSNQSGSHQSGSDTPNLFDSKNIDGGFTFDAFGLDQSQVEREVNEAMQALAGQGMPGFSAFFNNDTDGEFPMQTWDSPAGSRRSSPAPSDSEPDGFVDGFRVTQTTPNRSINYSSSSPASSEPSFSSPASRRLIRAQGRDTITPPRWQDSPKKSSGDIFGDTMSNPWKEDPWVSGDEGNYFSDSATNSDFGGTQSEILATTFKEQTPFKASFPETKSDIGVPTSYQKAVSFHQDVRSPRHKTPPKPADDLSSSSEDSANEEIDLAREYAQEFVRRMSPRHAQHTVVSQVDAHNYSPSPRSHSEKSPRQPYDQQYTYPNEQTPLDDSYGQAQEEMFQAEFGSYGTGSDCEDDQGPQFGAHEAASKNQTTSRQDEYDDGYHESSFEQEEQHDYGPSLSHSRNQQHLQNISVAQETAPRFTNIRKKYELSRASSTASSEGVHGGNETVKQNPQELTYEYGNMRSSYAVKNRSTPSAETTTTTAKAPPPWQRTQTTSSMANTYKNYEISRNTSASTSHGDSFSEIDQESPSENSGSRLEEKKDDEESSGPGKISTLKSKWKQWESKPVVNVAKSPPPQPIPKWKPGSHRPQHATLSAVEMLTPDLMEARRQEKRKNRADELRKANQEALSPAMLKSTSALEKTTRMSYQRASECQEERTSFASLRERLKPSNLSTKAKSDVGIDQRSSIASSVVDRLRRESPRAGGITDSKSDTGSSPSFLTGVKLRKTDTSDALAHDTNSNSGNQNLVNDLKSPQVHTPFVSYGERLAAAAQIEKQDSATPVERKLTYRERRELELKQAEEERSKVEVTKKEEPRKDVAALIRKRIAANKQKTLSTDCLEDSVSKTMPLNNKLNPIDSSFQNSPRQDWQAPTCGTHQSSPNRGNEQVQPPLRVGTSPEPSPRYSQSEIKTTNERYPEDDEPKGSTLLDNLSPASGVTNLTYSTDNSRPREDASSTPQSPAINPSPRASASPQHGEERFATSARLDALLSKRSTPAQPLDSTSHSAASTVPKPVNKKDFEPPEDGAAGKGDVKNMLSSFLGARNNPLALIPAPKKEDDADAIKYAKSIESNSPEKKSLHGSPPPPPPPASSASGQRPALKDDPKYERYFRMLKVGMPMEVVKHAMLKDGNDPAVMDGDHNKPVGLPLREDPKYTKYFKMLKLGISMPQVKHAMERDGLNPEVMDQDHNLPADACEKMSKAKSEPEQKDTHRRARLHWKTLQKITRNSLWSKIEKEPEVTNIDFDEEEFKELFQADITPSVASPKGISSSKKKGAAVRVIDAKRANNGGIILARVKMSHDEMADAVDRIDGDALTAEQIENIIEYLPTKEERVQLEKYMLEGGQDAAEKFDGLCECEKFMVSMMTVKHAKRKVNALLFKLQFISCLQSIAEDTQLIDDACDELQHSTRLRQLLGIVLQFGNRLNTAGKNKKNKAGAFTLDSLLKLSQAKAFDKKTTFLHYVVMIVHRNNEILLNFTDDLPTVLKADKVYWDQCLQDLEEVENQLENVRRISLYEARAKKQRKNNKNTNDHDDEDSLADIELTLEEEVEALRATPTGLFTLTAIKQVSALRDKVEATRSKFVRVLEYFGEDKDSMQPHELFNIFCVFGRDFNKAREEAFTNMKKKLREERKKGGPTTTPNGTHGKPPSGPERKTLKASSMQPHMNKVINDLKSPQRQYHGLVGPNEGQRFIPQQEQKSKRLYNANDPRRSHDEQRIHHIQHQNYNQYSEMNQNQQESRPSRNAYLSPPSRPKMPEPPVPRGMQESGQFEEVPIPRYSQSTSQHVGPKENSVADSLRQKARSRRQRQMQIVNGRAHPIASRNTLSITESRSPSSSPSDAGEMDGKDEDQGSPTSGSSRHSIRHRRLQAMKRVNATRIPSQSHSEWEASSQVTTN